MPAPGDQHKPNGAAITNPFEEAKVHISEYTAQEIATLQSRLNKRLGPEYISTRPGPGNQKIAYLSAEKAINLANEVFGFNGWSSSIQNIQIDFVDENAQSGKVSIGLSVVIRVTLRDGTYHEDIGYGGIENCKGKAMAFEKSKKEATTDALKRALRNFGNVLGNCIYDKDYVTKVSKVKAGVGKFDVNELHRHPDFAPKPSEEAKPVVQGVQISSKPPSLEFEDSFDVSEFDDIDFNENDLGHPDEVLLPADLTSRNQFQDTRSGSNTIQTPSKPPQVQQPRAHVVGPTFAPGQSSNVLNKSAIGPPQHPANRGSISNDVLLGEHQRNHEHGSSSPGVSAQHSVQPAPTGTPIAGFFSARTAVNVDLNDVNNLPQGITRFNPHSDSPSIRKTAGVDHSKSVPVRRESVKTATPPPALNVVEPRNDSNRRIGVPGPNVPGGLGRPGMSTSAYRPPTRHGSPAIAGVNPNAMMPPSAMDRSSNIVKRPPLGDVSNMQQSVAPTANDGADVKRQKVNDMKDTGPTVTPS